MHLLCSTLIPQCRQHVQTIRESPVTVDDAGALVTRLAVTNELHGLILPILCGLSLRTKRGQNHVNDMLTPSVEHFRLRGFQIEVDP